MENSIVNSKVVIENESIAREAFNRKDYVLCFLLAHTLIESLLRRFLIKNENESFDNLIKKFERSMQKESIVTIPFINELTQLNRKRNRIIHQLWEKGYSTTNKKLKNACQAAFIVFGLLIGWIETFDPDIIKAGFDYER